MNPRSNLAAYKYQSADMEGHTNNIVEKREALTMFVHGDSR